MYEVLQEKLCEIKHLIVETTGGANLSSKRKIDDSESTITQFVKYARSGTFTAKRRDVLLFAMRDGPNPVNVLLLTVRPPRRDKHFTYCALGSERYLINV